MFIGDAVDKLAWAGVAALIQTTPVLFNIVRYLGAFYLLWLGGKMLWSVITRQNNAHANGVEPVSAIMKRAAGIEPDEPQSDLFYVSFFVQFIDVSAENTGTSFLILATTLELISFIYMSFLIFSGAFVTGYLKTKKKLAKLGNGLIGLLFVGFAARLASLH